MPEHASANDAASAWRARAQRLQAAVAALAAPVGPLLTQALNALASGEHAQAVEQARAALAIDPRCGPAWRIAALALEGQGELVQALEAHQSSLALEGESADLLEDLGRLSLDLGMADVAVQLLARALAADPASPHLTAQLARALAGGHDYSQAIEVLRAAIAADVENAFLWNALGAVLLQQGDAANALTFFEQALSLAPDLIEPLYNRAGAKLDLDDLAGALADCDAALEHAAPQQTAPIRFVRSLVRLTQGELAGGWADYEARLEPDFAKAPVFRIDASRWTPDDDLANRRLLVVGEQGLGDEIMFAGMIPDVLAALGPGGRLSLAVEPRLVALFARSFPGAAVSAHATGKADGRPLRTAPGAGSEIELWAPMASLARRFRPDLASFAAPAGYLTPDPARLAYWRAALSQTDDRPKVGLVWKSLQTGGDRRKQYAPFEAWAPVLRTPGVRFVNLQYGDCEAELAQARALGVDIWTAPDLNLTRDIEGAAALSAATDLVLGVGNASANLAGACGVPLWLSLPPAAWPRLGAPTYPWFAGSRVFVAERFGEWEPVMAGMAGALEHWSHQLI
ncbi:MAG TPA: tetratricopeptide repeat protein [Caulobacteraceae bacterium]|nr:tetratricopeptide repeat protein [Caulobacteraceae bacterium]